MSTTRNRDISARLKAAISQDTFKRSTTAGSSTLASAAGWGTLASDGETWGGGSSPSGASYEIATLSSTKVGQFTGSTSTFTKLLGSGSQADAGVIGQVALSNTSDAIGLLLRFTSSSNQYRFQFDGSGNLAINKNVSGSVTTVVSTAFSVSTNTLYTIRGQCIGSALYIKAWLSSSTEPTSWTLTASDTSVYSGRTVGGVLPPGLNGGYRSVRQLRGLRCECHHRICDQGRSLPSYFRLAHQEGRALPYDPGSPLSAGYRYSLEVTGTTSPGCGFPLAPAKWWDAP